VSSRRRHTRSKRDWSSDVCSSDLFATVFAKGEGRHQRRTSGDIGHLFCRPAGGVHNIDKQRGGDITVIQRAVMMQARRRLYIERSEERRVGKGVRSGGWVEAGEEM